jgi:hypothetical protein
MDTDKARYVFRHYGHLMSEQERLANRHLTGTMKATHGRSDVAAQTEATSSSRHLRELLSDKPEVLRLASEGFETFVARTAERIFNDHRDEIVLNCCPRCAALARTPSARQCRFCGYDWHYDSATQNEPPTLIK